MAAQKELVMTQGSLYYEVRQTKESSREVVVTGADSFISELVIPDKIEDCPVTTIGKKAFLSRKQLRKVVLPDTIEELGDWAFAYCSGLEQVVLPGREIKFGRSLFLECGKLRKLTVVTGGMDIDAERSEGETQRDTEELLAAAVTVFDSYYLLDPVHAGTGEWLEKWDARLQTYLHADDQEGYSKQVLCGEEDYGSTDLEAFLSNKRKGKVRMCFLRLINSNGLCEQLRQELVAYLLAHTAREAENGQAAEPLKGHSGTRYGEEAWEIVLTEFGDERRYYESFAQLGCLTEENFGRVMADIGEDYPEMKAYFLKIKEQQIGYTDFFEELSLDL